MKIEIKKSINGQGVFALEKINKDERIILFKGKILKSGGLPFPYNSVEDKYVQVGPNDYMGPSGGADDLFNHSCDPNSGLKFGRKIALYAIRDILPGEEITWDYSTTMDEKDWEMKCCCGAKICRKTIKDFRLLPKHLKNKYKKFKIIPPYLLNK